MKIAINAAWMTPGKAGGMEWYARNLIRALGEADSANDYLLVTSDLNDHIFAAETPEGWRRLVHNGEDVSPASYRRDPIFDGGDRRLGRRLEAEGVDLIFCPFMYSLPEDTDIPVINTIPDLQHEHLPALFSPFELGSRLLGYRRSIDRATKVFAISHAVRDDILATYPGIDPNKVVAAPLGLNDDCRQIDPATAEKLAIVTAVKHRLDFQFVYYPANAWPHKNHEKLLEALRVTLDRGSDIHLVLSGSAENFAKEFGERVTELSLDGRVHHLGYVSRDEVFGLYARSQGLVLPSRFEGFGLPVLEAMQLQTRVACSAIPALQEVGGDLVDYFDPDDVEQIADAIGKFAATDKRDIDLDGYATRLASYGYDRTAAISLAAFADALAGQSTPEPLAVRRPVNQPGVAASTGSCLPITVRSPREVVVKCHRQVDPEQGPRPARIAIALDGVVVLHREVPATGSHRLVAPISRPNYPAPTTTSLIIEAFDADGNTAVDFILDELFVSDDHYGLVRMV